MKTALIVNDIVNDITHLDGLSNGCALYIHQHNILNNINKALEIARKKEILIIFIKIAFKARQLECSHASLFYKKQNSNALKFETWGTKIHSSIKCHKSDLLIIKNRIDPFFGTPLDSILRNNSIRNLVLTGVSTDLAVLAAALTGHDNDYSITILQDACGSLNEA